MSKKRTLPDDLGMDDVKTPPQKRQRKSNEKDDNTSQNLRMQQLVKKYNVKKQENMKLKENLLSKIVGVGDNSCFPNIEEFVNEYKVFMSQTHNNLLNALLDILEEIMENEENEEEDDDVDIEEDDVVNIEDIKYQKICYEILYNLISECYEKMKNRKNMFYEIFSKLLHCENNKKFKQKISMFIDSYLQNKWDTFITNKYYKYDNKFLNKNDDDKKEDMETNGDEFVINFDHQSIDKIIDNIYDEIKMKFVSGTNNKCSVLLTMLKTRKSIDIHMFIAKCCVLFWIMILHKQHTLKLTHSSFWIKETGKTFIKIHHSVDYDLKNDQKKEKKTVKYCGIPGVTVNNKHKQNETVVLIEPHIFVHDNPLVINALQSK